MKQKNSILPVLQKYFRIGALVQVCLAISTIGYSQVIYVTKMKDADLKVYVTGYKSEADLVVCKTAYKSDARGEKGLWYFTENKSDADKTVRFTESRADADLVIYFTHFKNDAGRVKKSEKGKMKGN